MKLRERWESQSPIARVGFFGHRGPEQSEVYDFEMQAPNLMSMAINRSNHLASVSITTPRLIYFVDINPRQARGPDVDARIFLDPELSIDVVTSTMSIFSQDVFQAMADFADGRVRALIGAASIQEITPLFNKDDFEFVSISDGDGPELWPEIRHKR